MTLAPSHWLGLTPPGNPAPAPLPEPPSAVEIPVAALPPLTNAQADLGGGDIRAILHALLRQCEAYYKTLEPQEAPVTFYIGSVDNPHDDRAIVRTYTVRVRLAVTPHHVADEPVLS